MNQSTVLITGCSAGGIGHAFAKEFHSRGHKVFATARRLESMSELESLEGITLMRLDVSEIDSIRKVRDEIASLTGGQLDILINNAQASLFESPRQMLSVYMANVSSALPVAVTDLEIDQVRALFDVNLFGPMAMVKEFIPLLLASRSACIVQTGSIGAVIPIPFSAAYNASKAALHAFVDALRIELAPFDNVKVVNMVTGGVKSNIARPRSMPENSLYKPMEDLYLKKRLNMSQENAMPTTQYAQEVAKEVLKSKPSVWFWIANLSSVAWFADRFIPQSLLTAIVAKRFGLDTFAARIASSNPPKSIASGKKSVLITGCSTGGIGHALAKEFYSRGHRVFATARCLESMSELDSLGITVLELDVTNVESIRQARDKIASIMDGKLDILVNNATMALVDEDVDAARDMFAVNVFAVISMVQEFLPLLRASGDGRVAQVESINSIFPVPFWGVYNSSKAALHALSNTMRVELEPFNIKVINLITGGVKTNIARPLSLPDHSLYKPIEHLLLKRRVGTLPDDAMPTADYARGVVTELLQLEPRAWFWFGANSTLCWFYKTFLWKTALDGLLVRRFGISEFATIVRSRKSMVE